ncbi:MAG: hypothetical protein K1Y02_12535 [Candidatus Hydrogenedentes bacterium]|nr:hypothetical protein [Candidatus Hydrogenedentota bacterium]
MVKDGRTRLALWLALFAMVWGAGCGYIADKNRIRIATMDGKPITRGDLTKILHDMDPDERPTIKTRGDLLKALQNYIDMRLKNELAKSLKDQGKIHVPRELAERIYLIKNPEQVGMIGNPEEYKLTQRDIEYMKQERELGIDKELEKLEAEQAVAFRIDEAMKSGLIQILDEEYQSEYETRKQDLKHYEKVSFRGVFVPASNPEAGSIAASIVGRLHAGESIDDVAKSLANAKADILEAQLSHDPRNQKFAGFWQQAAESKPGDIVGPIFIQGWERGRLDAQGKQILEQLPESLLVAQVVDEVPETQKTLEESKEALAPLILYAKVMDQLRKEHGVSIFEENLPDPSMYDTTRSSVIIR